MAAAVLSHDLASGYGSGLYSTTPGSVHSISSHKKPSFPRSTKAVSDEYSAGANSYTPSSRSYKQPGLRTALRSLDSDMTYTTTSTLAAPRSDSRQKLHKRAGSGSSSQGARSHFITPYATYEEPFPDVSSATPTPPTPKVKPYLRKISKGSRDDPDQGRVDLSKSVSENSALAGLGIQDFGARTAADVNFFHTGRRTPHARTTSVGSQVSNGSGSYRPTPTFVHPMSKTPNRPYTPPTTDVSSMVDNETHESSDVVVDDDAQFGQGFRTGRSMSLSSTPQVLAPTPLSQSYTAASLGGVPALASASQTNLSTRSGRSGKSSRLVLGRARADTNRSVDFIANSPSSRTSFDKPFSFISRRSDTDPLTRDERIRAARRKFEEKEARKDGKVEKASLKRQETERRKQERQRRKSETSERSRISKSNSKKISREGRKKSEEPEITALPRHRGHGTVSEKNTQKQNPESQAGWSRFTDFLQGCFKDKS